VLCCLTSLPRLTVRQIQHTCMPTNIHQQKSIIPHEYRYGRAPILRHRHIYSTMPPSRPTFHLAGMPSPPAALRPLVNRLNRIPTRRERAIKAKPMSSPSRPDSVFGQLAPASRQQSALQNTVTSGSNSSWISTDASDNSALSQALVNLLNTPPATNTTPLLHFQGCRVELHFHIHLTVRPASPPRYSRSDTLKRKRDARNVDAKGPEILERQVKRVKLSHDSQAGYKIGGHANARKRPERMTAADGVKARSRAGQRRMSSRARDGDRGRF
jgi:hypothetical protein